MLDELNHLVQSHPCIVVFTGELGFIEIVVADWKTTLSDNVGCQVAEGVDHLDRLASSSVAS